IVGNPAAEAALLALEGSIVASLVAERESLCVGGHVFQATEPTGWAGEGKGLPGPAKAPGPEIKGELPMCNGPAWPTMLLGTDSHEERKEPEMTATTTLSRVRLIAARVRETLAEMDYAQRRMTEIRMGLPLVEPVGRTGIATTVP